MRTFDIDVGDDDAVRAWCAPIQATEAHVWPDVPTWRVAELRALGTSTRDDVRVCSAVADDAGVVVGAALAELSQRDNLDLAELFMLAIEPARRREGFGRALLAHVEELAASLGRTRLLAPIEVRLDAPDLAGERFATASGFELGFASSKRCLGLPMPSGVLEAIEAEAASHASAGYEVLAWIGGCPEHLLEDRIRLAVAMSTDVPHGEIAIEAAVLDADAQRAYEASVEAMDRTVYAAGAVRRGTGELVAFSDIAIPRTAPEVGYQYDTIVAGPHRGHRLGLLVKAANLRQVARESPSTARVLTWNADSNAPMVSVNEALGFVRVSRGGIWQKRLG